MNKWKCPINISHSSAYATFSLAEYVLVGINSVFYFLLVWEFDGSKVEVYVKHRHQITRNDICI